MEPKIARTPVTSSNVISVGYDPAVKQLDVEFKGGVYRYYDVQQETFDELMKAESKGGFVHSKIVKGGFKYVRHPDVVEDTAKGE